MAIERRTGSAWRIHPGNILKHEFMAPLGLSSYRLARELHVSVPTVHQIVRSKRAVTADLAARLARFLGTTELFWLNLQAAYDIHLVKTRKRQELKRIRPLRAAEIA